jgi:gluconate 2-dehydrogenase alpha chain
MGRMVNGVGGSIVHYGAWLRRFHPHHLRLRTHVAEKWGLGKAPKDLQIADWPVSYDDLERYYAFFERYVGVAGDETNPFIKRSQPLPMPPTRPFRMGELFKRAATEMGLHPYPVPAGLNTIPYQGQRLLNTALGSQDSDLRLEKDGTRRFRRYPKRWPPEISNCARTAE